MLKSFKAGTDEFDRGLAIIVGKQTFCFPFYTLNGRRVSLHDLNEKNKFLKDYSVVWYFHEVPVIGFLGVMETNEVGICKLSYGEFGGCVLFQNPDFQGSKISKTIQKKIIDQFSPFLHKSNISFELFDYIEGGSLSILSNFFLNNKASLKVILHNNIDLALPVEKIKSVFRKSFKSLINWGYKNLKIELVDSRNVKPGDMLGFQKLHLIVSGRATRSDDYWKIRSDLIDAGQGFMIRVSLADTIVSNSFFIHDFNNVYYLSSASLRDYFSKPIMHSSVFRAIEYSKLIGCKNFILGQSFFQNLDISKSYSEKELSISKFKEGFGGNLRPIISITYP